MIHKVISPNTLQESVIYENKLRKDILEHCDAVILAGGQAQRMGGCNKLLQCFDGQCRQLEKLSTQLKPQVQRLWINSHRDHEIYHAIDRKIGIFADIESGFYGPMMGMWSAWLYSQQDWILFVPCDLYQIPEHLLTQMAATLHTEQRLCYARINDQDVYPLCLMHRSIAEELIKNIEAQQYSLHRCFAQLDVQIANFYFEQQAHHSINRWSEIVLRPA